jgi:hypothetical protein
MQVGIVVFAMIIVDLSVSSPCVRSSIVFARCSDIFAGQLKSTLECSYCQYQSTTFDMFWDLSIPLPRVSRMSINDATRVQLLIVDLFIGIRCLE